VDVLSKDYSQLNLIFIYICDSIPNPLMGTNRVKSPRWSKDTDRPCQNKRHPISILGMQLSLTHKYLYDEKIIAFPL
jgi:hypothetical protein